MISDGVGSARGYARTPLPKLQLSLLLVLLLAEPITSTVIYPFIAQLVNELGITGGDERKTGYYVGLIESFFFLIESLLILQWGRLSDKLGRKPVLLVGLFGLSLSMICFGLSKNFVLLMLSRGLEGALNGNIAVIKSMFAELTDETNRPQAFAFIPITWASGSTIGPIIGGLLAPQSKLKPLDLETASFLHQYPYFLPCFAAAAYSMFAFMVSAAFLKETRPTRRTKSDSIEESIYISRYSSNEVDSEPDAPLLLPEPTTNVQRPPSLRSLLRNPRIRHVVLNYAILALLDIAFVALRPLVFATPISSGGLGLSPLQIGTALGVFGLIDGIIEILFFAPLCRKIGTKNVYLLGVASCPFAFAAFPMMNFLAKKNGLDVRVCAIMILQLICVILTGMAFACIAMFVTSSAPTSASLGATNGLAQTATSFMRAIGPASATSLYAFSIERNLAGGGLVYWILIFFTLFAFAASRYLPKEPWKAEETDIGKGRMQEEI